MHEPSLIQRLLREKALGGYLTALERGDIDGIIASLERAENDPILEHMILEVHESYQTEEEFQARFQEEPKQEPRPSTTKENSQIFPPDYVEAEELELEPISQLSSVPQRGTDKPALWRRILAAILLIAFLGSSILIYARWQQSIGTPPLPPIHYNWCAPPRATISTQTIPDNIFSISSNDTWLLGERAQLTQIGQISLFVSPDIEHWNGQSWDEVPTANPTTLFTNLLSHVTSKEQIGGNETFNDLAILSPDNIWAVGSIELTPVSIISTVGSQSIDTLSQTTDTVLAEQALIEHWDGNTWSIVPVPNIPDQGTSSFSSIAAVSADNIWAIGSVGAGGNTNVPLIERWNGQTWQAVSFPAQQLNVGSLQMVKVVSANDIWLFGLLKASVLTSIAVHWNGQNWQSIALPDAIRKSWFIDALVIASNNIWATGGGASSGQAYPSFLAHWDGKQWNLVAGAQGIQTGSRLNKLAASGANDIWAVGNIANNRPLIEHWDGQTWKLWPLNTASYGSITGITVNGNQVWIAGIIYKNATDYTVNGPIVETNCP